MNIDLSIVIPAYKETRRIGVTLESIASYVESSELSIEVLVVDDGSPDETAQIVTAYEDAMPYLTLLRVKKNRGKGNAVRIGMQHAKGRYRLFMDADNSVDVRHVDRFLQVAKQGADVIIGSIALSSSKVTEQSGAHRRILGWVSKLPIRIFATPGIRDTQRGFKLFSERAADIIFPRQTIERFGFDIELLVIALKHRLRIQELPVVWNNPDGSSVRLSDYIRTFWELGNILIKKWSGAYGSVGREAKHLHPFSKEKENRVGKGFHYNGKEFIHHTDLHHKHTAVYTLLHSQKIIFIGFIIILIESFILNWHLTLIVVFSSLTILYFLDLIFNGVLIYRSFSAIPEVHIADADIDAIDEASLPIYTIFCPLYKEWQVVPQFAAAMEKLDYPKDKLQIMFLLEENDPETIAKIEQARLPAHFEIVVVPHSFPKTKPKAMNYGLNHVRGEYVVIYDAEDVPETDQLKKAYLAFKSLPKTTVCIQAKLNFYNKGQNILTRLFTAEYSLWFDLVLPGLQSFNAPIPLGGTSNHFKVDVLKGLYGWDSFNVTEDCDLGMRLAKQGFRTAIIESTTYEEANSRALNWHNQRSRWIKGYIQTYLVHMREPDLFSSWRAFLDFFIFQLTVGGKILSLFINPLMWVITICYFAFRVDVGIFIESLFPGPILYIGVFSFIFGNFLYLYYYMIGCAKRGYDSLIKYSFLVPFYWLAMSFAAWKALYEIFVKPHYWAKTVHGLHLPTTQSSRIIKKV